MSKRDRVIVEIDDDDEADDVKIVSTNIKRRAVDSAPASSGPNAPGAVSAPPSAIAVASRTAAPTSSAARQQQMVSKTITQAFTGGSSTLKRIAKEYREMINDPPHGCTASLIRDEDLFNWRCSIEGPPDTPYAKGRFNLRLMFPPTYPFKPPMVNFETKIYHCNINSNGNICLDTLKNNWSPALTTSKLLLTIISLLSDPNPSDPLVGEIANLYVRDRKQHDRNARDYTRRYALPINSAKEPIVL